MKVKVTVKLKDGVLDPQGQTIAGALTRMGYEGVSSVRVGKVFDVVVDDAPDALDRVKEFAGKVLVNPIIETFDVSVEGEK